METNLAFVDTTQSPLKHQLQLDIDMWNILINQMERRSYSNSRRFSPVCLRLLNGDSRLSHRSTCVGSTVYVFAQNANISLAKNAGQADDGNKKLELPMSQLEQSPAARRWSRHKIDVRLKVSFPTRGKMNRHLAAPTALAAAALALTFRAPFLLAQPYAWN